MTKGGAKEWETGEEDGNAGGDARNYDFLLHGNVIEMGSYVFLLVWDGVHVD
jgi:hypothetical protein